MCESKAEPPWQRQMKAGKWLGNNNRSQQTLAASPLNLFDHHGATAGACYSTRGHCLPWQTNVTMPQLTDFEWFNRTERLAVLCYLNLTAMYLLFGDAVSHLFTLIRDYCLLIMPLSSFHSPKMTFFRKWRNITTGYFLYLIANMKRYKFPFHFLLIRRMTDDSHLHPVALLSLHIGIGWRDCWSLSGL